MSLGFKLWNINSRIEECIDNETGEILEEELLNELEQDKENLIEDTALVYKNLNAELEALTNEIKNMQERKKSVENKIDTIKRILKESLKGQKIKTARVSISYRKTQAVQITNLDKIPQEYIKIKKEADKTAIKKALKAGSVEGAEITNNTSIIIR